MHRREGRFTKIDPSINMALLCECQASGFEESISFVFENMKPVVEAVETVGTVGNSERNGVDWRVFHGFHSLHSLHYLSLSPSGVTSTLLQPKERLTAIRGTTQMVVTLSWMRPSLGRSRKPRVLCLQEANLPAFYGCSLWAMPRRSLGPPVSSAVKGAVELSTRNSYGRCSFNTA